MSRLKKAFRTNTGTIPTTGDATSGGTTGGTNVGASSNGQGATPQTPGPASVPMSGMNEFVLPQFPEKEIELEVPESHKAIADKTFFGLENVSLLGASR